MKSPGSLGDSLDSPPFSTAKSPSPFFSSVSSQPRKKWAHPELDICDDLDLVHSESSVSVRDDKAGRLQFANSALKYAAATNISLGDENIIPNLANVGNGLTSTQIHNISQKIHGMLHLNNKATQDLPVSENFMLTNSLDNTSNQSLSSLVSSLLGDRRPEEVPALVEFMLRKIMEEFERRLICQIEQIIHLKKQLNENATRKDKLAMKVRVLETLVAGSGEEYKILSGQLQKMKDEKSHVEEEKKAIEEEVSKLLMDRDEKLKMVDSLREELERTKCINQDQIQELNIQKNELELELQTKLKDMKLLMEDSHKKVGELEVTTAQEIESLKGREAQYQTFIQLHLELLQDLKKDLQSTRQDMMDMQEHWMDEIEDLDEQLRGLTNAASSYHKVLAENRQLYNEVQDLKGNIRVYCRVRPFLTNPSGPVETTVDFIGENGDIIIVNPGKNGKDTHKNFSFNKVFGPSATQGEVFSDTQPLIRSVLDGYKVCIFAYGQTGSGKTYTMSGPKAMSEAEWGVNYRALNDLFQISLSRQNAIKYGVSVQMVEIYNEQVRDLLASEGPNKKLEIRNNSQTNGLNVPDASVVPVNMTEDVLELMKIGQKNRAVSATALNDRSSRSHSVLTVHVQGTDFASGNSLRGCLHLVDLAGSERIDKSEVAGDRLKEAVHINKSLSALGDVIAALAQKSSHVPYRNSKLTQLLQDSLGGQAKTLMFVHISPEVDSYVETISTLKFAERVASVELGAARSNKESKELKDLKEQVALLKDAMMKKDAEIERLQNIKEPRHAISETAGSFDRSKAKPSTAFTNKSTRIRRLVESSTNTKKLATSVLLNDISIDSEPASEDSSPRDVKASPWVGESEREKLGRSKVSRNQGSQPSKISSNDQISASQTVPIQPKQRTVYDLPATEQDPGIKEWKDRIQSSTDSSLFGMPPPPEEPSFSWDNGQNIKNDRESWLPFSTVASLGYNADLNPQGLSGTKSGNSLNMRESDFMSRYILESSQNTNSDISAGETREGEGSDLSDGELSVAETEVSQISTLDHVAFNDKKEYDRVGLDDRRRKPPLAAPSNLVPRTERKSLQGSQSLTRTKRPSPTTAAAPMITKPSNFKRQGSYGVRQVGEVGTSSSKSVSMDGSGFDFPSNFVQSRPSIIAENLGAAKSSKAGRMLKHGWK